MNDRLTTEDIKEFEPEAKIGILGTIDGQGLPHISLITTLRAKGPSSLTWAQFCEGRSKSNVRANPKTGFLVMNARRELWRGRALWTHTRHEGEEYELYNDLPMFRYNSYFGIHTVHYMDLIETGGREGLPLGGILAGTLLTLGTGGGRRRGDQQPVLKPWAAGHLGRLSTLKFIAHVDDEGFPSLAAVVPCRPAGSDRLIFAGTGHGRQLRGLEPGKPLAVFGLNLQMESVLVRGSFGGWRGPRGLGRGVIDLDWAYNSMPPKQGRIYPSAPLEPVRSFE